MEVYKMLMTCCLVLAIAFLPPSIGPLPDSAAIPGVVDTLYIPSQRPGLMLLSTSGGLSDVSPEEVAPEPEPDPEPEAPADIEAETDITEPPEMPGEPLAGEENPSPNVRNVGVDYEQEKDADPPYDSDTLSSIDHSLKTVIGILTVFISVGIVRLIMKPLFYLTGF